VREIRPPIRAPPGRRGISRARRLPGIISETEMGDTMARKPDGWKLVEKLDGSKQAKARARAIVKSLTGEATIEEAAAEANVAPSRFHLLRERALEEMVRGLEPRTPGRKPAEPDLEAIEREKEALASRVKELEIELAKSRVREVTARWGESGGKRWGPRRRK